MKKLAFISLLLSVVCNAKGQVLGPSALDPLDTLRYQLQTSRNDTVRVKTLISLSNYYAFSRQDSSIYFLTQSIGLSDKMNYTYGSFAGYSKLSFVLNTLSNYPRALQMALKSLKLAEQLKTKRKESMAEAYHLMALLNNRMGNDSIGLVYALRSIQLFKESGVQVAEVNFGPSLIAALIYLRLHKPDSALFYAKMGYEITSHYRSSIALTVAAGTVALVYEQMHNLQLARQYESLGLHAIKQYAPDLLTVRFYNNYARFLNRTGNLDSCIYYARTALQLCQNRNYGEHATDAATILTQAYETQQMPDSALKYMKAMVAIRDTIFNQTKLQQVVLLNFDEGQRQRDIAIAKERYRNKVRFFALISAVGIFLLLVIILYRNNLQKQRAKNSIEKAYSELKTTQAQLVQSEKMASLGELTAGIAHEIQNPLNFVNNFSEVNKELLAEMNDEIAKGNYEDVRSIAKDVMDNQEKINLHGKRADAIVKNMLQHSRSSSGKKEPTDINELTDEYLRLAYHRLRAKDKAFNAIPIAIGIESDLDPSVGKVNIVPQDIGMVLLNLYNNAFYAVNEKARLLQLSKEGGDYGPRVTVNTKKKGDKILISVADNGNGISGKVLDKIFQPFFTTKPAGEGTGLGLSLSYDIVKSQGGEIKVENRESEGATFIIVIPITQ